MTSRTRASRRGASSREPKRNRWGVLFALLMTLSSVTSAAGPHPLAAYEGSWERTDVELEDAARHAEIDRAIADLSFLVRGLARSVMQRRMTPDPGYRMQLEGEALEVSVAGKPRSSLVPDGTLRTTEEGEVRDAMDDGVLVRHWNHGDDGHGLTRWELSPDARRLLIRVTAHNPNLDTALHYVTSYRRVEEGTAP